MPSTPTTRRTHAELPPVSEGYPPPRARLPTCSSPVRHVRSPKQPPFDLHALGTPPALILSQDQTLHHDLSCPASPTRISRSRPPPPRSFVRFWLWSPIRARAPEGPAAPHRLHSVFRAHPAHPRLRSLPCSDVRSCTDAFCGPAIRRERMPSRREPADDTHCSAGRQGRIARLFSLRPYRSSAATKYSKVTNRAPPFQAARGLI